MKKIIFCKERGKEPQAMWLKGFLKFLNIAMKDNDREADVVACETIEEAQQRIALVESEDVVLCFTTLKVAVEAREVAIANPKVRVIVFTAGFVSQPDDALTPDNFEVVDKTKTMKTKSIDNLFFG